MATETREITLTSCDSAKCKVRREGGPENFDFAGTVTVETETSGENKPWVACRPAHIKGAVLAVTGRADEARRGGLQDED